MLNTITKSPFYTDKKYIVATNKLENESVGKIRILFGAHGGNYMMAVFLNSPGKCE